jgi:hypothetical protein
MSKKTSFWSTIPGILTGLAAIITACAGLLIALSQTGILYVNKSDEGERQNPIVESSNTYTIQLPQDAGSESTIALLVQLRSEAGYFSKDEIGRMVIEKNFRDSELNPDGDFLNEYSMTTIKGDKVVIDKATSLVWQKSGSENMLSWEDAQSYIRDLNKGFYANYSDWRLPTTEELATLLEPTKTNGNLYLDAMFSARQQWCWTADKLSESESSWNIDFENGDVGYDALENKNFVRAVRSMEH